MVYLVDFGVNSMPCLQLQVVTLHVLCSCAEPHPSLDLIPALQCRTPKPVEDTTDNLLSLARCSETGVTVGALLLDAILAAASRYATRVVRVCRTTP